MAKSSMTVAVSMGSGFHQEEMELHISGLKLKKKNPARTVLCHCTLLKTVGIL